MMAAEVKLLEGAVQGSSSTVPHIISNGRQREFGTVSAQHGIAVFVGDGACAPVGTAQAVQANDKEARLVEGLSGTSQQRTPPIGDISAPAEGVADHQGIVTARR
jgi:hypothetical protein